MTKKTERYKAMPTPEESSQRKNDFISPVFAGKSIIEEEQQKGTKTIFSHPVVDCSVKRKK